MAFHLVSELKVSSAANFILKKKRARLREVYLCNFYFLENDEDKKFVFLVDEGRREDPNTTISKPILARP